MSRGQASWFLHQAADRRNLHTKLACLFILLHGDQACLEGFEIHRLQQTLRRILRRSRIVAVVIKRNFHTVSSCCIHCQLEEMMSVFGVEVFAAQAVNTADYLRSGIAICEQRRLDFVDHVAAVSADRIRTVSNRNSLHILQRFSNLLLREWTDHVRGDGTGFDSLQAKLVDHILDDLRSGVHQEYSNIGIFHPVLLNHRIVASGQLGELLGNLFEYFTGIVHGNGLLVTVVDIIRFVHVRANSYRIVAVQCICKARRGLLAYELMNILAVGKSLDTAFLMGREIAVGSDHDRKADLRVLSQLQGHQVHVIDGLGVPAHQNRPAGIQGKI
ncbi:hypothetical protein D3C74_332070 [compost metagenome]